MPQSDLLRSLPKVDRLAAHPRLVPWVEQLAPSAVRDACRQVIDAARTAIRDGAAPAISEDALAATVALRLAAEQESPLPPTLNATGILIHTGLGRAVMADEAAAALDAAARNYVPVELVMATGQRGLRHDTVRPLLRAVTGAENGLVVNNNAAATLLGLRAIGDDFRRRHPDREPEAILSRGELVEIGGGFRMPDVMRAAGLKMVEVGTTNKTRLADYAQATNGSTCLYLKIHTSNFRIVGFTQAVSVADLAGLAKKTGVKVMDDIGSGALQDLADLGLVDEPTVRASIEAGADLVCFSGDKLLGGPQAGLLVGNNATIGAIENHPLVRALRPCKLTLAALAATLQLHRDPAVARRRIPLLRMLATPVSELQAQAEALAQALSALPGVREAVAVTSQAYTGGGANPAQQIESRAVYFSAWNLNEDELARRLRRGRPSVLPRVADGAVWLDLRSLLPGQAAQLPTAVALALQPAAAAGA